ncbi:histidine phosphatase family protein [Actinokineospora sp.]|uniref:histidine phosphatase family protein n=1 Tax=Actinokineospora sp. TaxID=1872133 RepID=UPI004037EEB8
MSAIYLLRHGQASFGSDDYDVLAPAGELQAKVLGEELRGRGLTPAQAWSGTLSRQRATASVTLAAAGFDLPCQTDPRWDEYDFLAIVEQFTAPDAVAAATPRDFQALLDSALHHWVAGDPAGAVGTYADFAAGAVAALAEVGAGLGSGGTGVVFTSGGVISAICARLLGLPAAGFVTLNRVMVNAAVTKVVHGRSGASLVSFNEHGHFEGANRDLLTYR